MICPKCKAMLAHDATYCNRCGAVFQTGNNFSQQQHGNVYQQNSGMGPVNSNNFQQNNTDALQSPSSTIYTTYQDGGPQNSKKGSATGYWDRGKWVPYNNYNRNVKPKNNSGCLPAVIIGILFIVFIIYAINKPTDDNNNRSSNSDTIETTTEEMTEEEITEEEIPVATVTDAVVFEGNDVIVELKSLEDNTLNFYIENNSDKNLSSSMHAYAINGFMADNNIYDMHNDIAANSKANISFDIPETLESGYEIEYIKRMDFLIWFYDNDASFKEFDTGIITVETNLADGTLDNNIGMTEILNENDISYKLVEKSDDKVVIGINNNSDTYYALDGKNVVVNGYSLDTSYDFDIYDKLVFPQCSYPMTFEFDWDSDENFKEKNGIEKVENVSLDFAIRANGDYFSESTTSKLLIDYSIEEEAVDDNTIEGLKTFVNNKSTEYGLKMDIVGNGNDVSGYIVEIYGYEGDFDKMKSSYVDISQYIDSSLSSSDLEEYYDENIGKENNIKEEPKIGQINYINFSAPNDVEDFYRIDISTLKYNE